MWLDRVVTITLALVLVSASGMAQERDEALVRTAIVDAVQARLGADAGVAVTDLELHVTDEAAVRLIATPEPGARLGAAMQFNLSKPTGDPGARTRSVGRAVATVTVIASHVRLARPVVRSSVLTADDLQDSRGEVGDVPLKALPRLADLVGATAVRDLGVDEVVISGLVRIPPLVRSGQMVLMRWALGSVEARGRGVASQNGQRGDIIRLVNPDSGRRLQGRVVAPGEVEVVR